ncbi:hypothetical protein [Oryzibacter oryziterrae]|uniref:hypothetical protein n=1 Tax=Oryzibacter oryziterrae TaxID=2766474 RepID=UPI001F350FFF|nr:hypothetical protein [Oryzibacter oryziterrae]
MAIIVALMVIPLLLATGVAMDYVRAYNVQLTLRADLDISLISAIKKINNLDDKAIKTLVINWFKQNNKWELYSLTEDAITVTKTDYEISASASATVPTSFMILAHIDEITVGATSSVRGPSTSYLNVYLVLDKSASMMLAATPEDQNIMRDNFGCVFACHDVDSHISPEPLYPQARALNVRLRADILQDSANAVLTEIENADPTRERIKVGLYRLARNVTKAVDPTFDIGSARAALTSPNSGLDQDSSTDGTFFQQSMKDLAALVGQQGDGRTAASPLKLVLMVTDGVTSQRNKVVRTGSVCSTGYFLGVAYPETTCQVRPSTYSVGPLNPAWCNVVKNQGVTFGILYTKYLPVPEDWGWMDTLGWPMSKMDWYAAGGSLERGYSSSILRFDYIPVALQACTSNTDLFLSANSVNEITNGLRLLFKHYISEVRITR